MKRLLAEPLVHFIALGALLFAAYDVLNRYAAPPLEHIVVSEGQIAAMAENFARIRQRPPTSAELAGLIQARVREEVYYREALALGLDQDDVVIRRRLQQKMEFISDDIAAQVQPTEAELTAFLEAHADRFRVAPGFTFRQVYLDPQKHGTDLARVVAQLLARLNQAGNRIDASEVGDRTMLEHAFAAVPAGEVARQFGDGFASVLAGLAPGRWQGPVESAYGVHLVSVSERTAARMPVLAEVRDRVRREWEDAKRQEANEKFFRELLGHYTVTIENRGPLQTESDTAGQ